jgi:hypothetical protein
MSATLHHFKEAEDRLKASLFSAASSTVVLGVLLLIVLAFGIYVAQE